MKEQDIQNYLYANPEILFPSGNITEKAREYSIQGKRIDLLFIVDGIRYIVEIKNIPIQREHIGQVVEYYGLMRHYMEDANLAMILVSSSIPAWRAAYLEEIGIRCVEIPTVPTTKDEQNNIQKDSRNYEMRVKQMSEVESIVGYMENFSFEEIAGPVTPKSLYFAQRMLKESLEPIRKSFNNEYEVMPIKIKRSYSSDFDLEHDTDRNYGTREFTHGGTWWAYRFGFSENMPKNDVPNVSIIAYATGLDITINAELQPSQKVMLERIRKSSSRFNELLCNHGGLWLKTYLKYEHKPRSYHWILADIKSPGEFDGEVILQMWHKHQKAFNEERERWLKFIISVNKELSEKQIQHLEARTKQLNLAIRLVERFQKNATMWSLQDNNQVDEIVRAVLRMKPLIDFFVR